MKTELINVTPDMAMRFLEKNKLNRSLTDRHINFLASQMRENKWLDTGDTLKFDEQGNLLDGQHRLNAIVKSGKTLPMLVVKNVNKKAFEVMDTGKVRTGKDVLSAMKYGHSSLLSSSVKSILLYFGGQYSHNKIGKSSFSTNPKVVEFVKKNEEIHEIVAHIHKIHSKFKLITASHLVFLYWIFAAKNQNDVDTFFDQLTTGVDLKADSPIKALRDRLIKEITSKRKMQAREKLALCIIAWNHFRAKKPVKLIQFTDRMEFPKPL